MPRYREASYAGETSVLENRYLRLELHKRVTGWGWGELLIADRADKPAKFFAVLESLAEAHIGGHARPFRLEAKDCNSTRPRSLKRSRSRSNPKKPFRQVQRWNRS